MKRCLYSVVIILGIKVKVGSHMSGGVMQQYQCKARYILLEVTQVLVIIY